MIFPHRDFILFHILLFSKQNLFLIKNPRQSCHKGKHFRGIGEGIGSIQVYMLEKYCAQIQHFQDNSEKLFTINQYRSANPDPAVRDTLVFTPADLQDDSDAF